MVAFRLHPYYMLFIQFCKPLVLIFKNLFISYCLQSTAKTYGFALYFDFVYLLFCINHGVKGGGGRPGEERYRQAFLLLFFNEFQKQFSSGEGIGNSTVLIWLKNVVVFA